MLRGFGWQGLGWDKPRDSTVPVVVPLRPSMMLGLNAEGSFLGSLAYHASSDAVRAIDRLDVLPQQDATQSLLPPVKVCEGVCVCVCVDSHCTSCTCAQAEWVPFLEDLGRLGNAISQKDARKAIAT